MNADKLKEVLANHQKWLNCDGGKLAELWGADLRDAYLRGADLNDADLRGANLNGAYLRGTILDPHITIRNRNHAIETGQSDIIAYRTKTSQHVGNTTYEPGEWHFAPVMSWCPATECHPGLYAGTLEQTRKEYPNKPLVKVRVPAGAYIVVDKGIRCAGFEVLEDVDDA